MRDAGGRWKTFLSGDGNIFMHSLTCHKEVTLLQKSQAQVGAFVLLIKYLLLLPSV